MSSSSTAKSNGVVATTTPNKKGQQQQQDGGTSSASNSSTVQVVVRLRPLNEREKKHGTLPVITASTNDKTVTVIKGVGSRQVRSIYKFNNVFTSFSTQEEIFDSTLKPIINDVIYLGYESTVFAYGQTGTGKTYTMEGELKTLTTTIVGSEKTNNNNGIIGTGGGGATTTKTTKTTSPPDDDDSLHGVIPRSANAIFNELEQDENCISYTVTCSFLEIYNEELCDLLAVATTSAESGGGGGGANTPTTPTATSDRNPYG